MKQVVLCPTDCGERISKKEKVFFSVWYIYDPNYPLAGVIKSHLQCQAIYIKLQNSLIRQITCIWYEKVIF